jgi:hypothetical protein
VNLANKNVETHKVIHMGVADEDGADRFQFTFRHMVEGAAVDHDTAMDGTVADNQTGVFDKTCEKIRLKIAKKSAHGQNKVKVKVEAKAEIFP